MSFEGSLQTVPLPEVLHLLADTSKSGELYVSGPGVGGRFWFESGEYSGYDVGRCDHAVDALFELLRVEHGDFVFDSDAVRPDGAKRPLEADRCDIRPLLAHAEARLSEWREIVAVVPSLGHEVYLVADPGPDQLSIDRSQWSLVVAIGEGRAVQQILDERSLPEFDGCKAIKGLVDAGLTEVVDPTAAAVAESVRAEAEAAESAAQAAQAAEAAQAAQAAADEAARDQAEAAAHADADEAARAETEAAAAAAAADDAGESDSDPALEEESPVLIGAVTGAGADESAATTQSARHALTALIDGMAAEADRLARTQGDGVEDANATTPPDGLADRGPWTSHELASLDQSGEWADEEDPDETESPEDESAEPAPEPINRGLLLKFLSSVRS